MPRTTHRVEKRQLSQSESVESRLDKVAKWNLTIGIVSAVISLALLSPVACGFLLMFSFGQWAVLKAFAEQLRIQKRTAGLDYDGAISGARLEVTHYCGYCGQLLHSEHRCDACGATVVDEGATDSL